MTFWKGKSWSKDLPWQWLPPQTGPLYRRGEGGEGRRGRCRNTRSSFSNQACWQEEVKIKSRKMESCWRIGPCSHSSFFKDHGLHLRNSLRTRGSLLKIIWRSGRWGISWRVRRGAGLHKNRRTSAVHCSHHSLRRRSSWYPAWVHEDTTGGGKGFRSIVIATSSLVHHTGSCRILVRLTVLVRIHWSCWKITLLCLTADWRQLNLYPWCLDPVISYLALWIG